MDFFFGLLQIIGVHTLLGLSAYVVLQTGQVTLAQAGFFSIGAYVSAMLTVLAGWHIIPALLVSATLAGIVAGIVGFPALRIKGLMLVVATIAFGEFIRLFWFNFDYQIEKKGIVVGPQGGEGFKQIRFFPENGWSTLDVAIFIWVIVALVMLALWWTDRSRAGTVLRAVGEDELAAQSVGINLTAVKVGAFAAGGFIAGIGGCDLRPLHDAHRAPQLWRHAGDLRHRLSDSGRAPQCLRYPRGGDLHPGISRRGPALHGRLAKPAVRGADRARHEHPAARA